MENNKRKTVLIGVGIVLTLLAISLTACKYASYPDKIFAKVVEKNESNKTMLVEQIDGNKAEGELKYAVDKREFGKIDPRYAFDVRTWESFNVGSVYSFDLKPGKELAQFKPVSAVWLWDSVLYISCLLIVISVLCWLLAFGKLRLR